MFKKLYRKIFWKFKVMRTIFPYEDGWGVALYRPFSPLTVCAVGLETKDEAEEYAQLLKEGE